jgi:hypothetical protein
MKQSSTSHDLLNDLNIQMSQSVLFRENGIEHRKNPSTGRVPGIFQSFQVFRFTSFGDAGLGLIGSQWRILNFDASRVSQ